MTSRMAARILIILSSLAPLAAQADSKDKDKFPFLEATVAQLQAEMAAGSLTSQQLTRAYIERIEELDSAGPGVNSIMELNPDALEMARKADELRRKGVVLGPLHGIHWRQDADQRRIVCARGTARVARFHRRRESACRGCGHPRKDDIVRVGKFPLNGIDQRLVGSRRSGAQPLRH